MKWKLDLNSKYKDIKVNIQASEITEEISRLTTFMDQISNTIVVKKADQFIEVDILEVIYIENLERMNFIYTYSDIYEVSSPLYELEEKLKRFGFIRVNKQTLINPRCIKSVRALLNSRFELLMTSDEKVIVTRHYRKRFNSLFKEGGIYSA